MIRLNALFLFFWMCVVNTGWSTHNRAGEITYCHIEGFRYGITVTTYTKASSTQADRCELEVFYGDGLSDTIYRINGPSCSGNLAPCNACGELVGNDIKKNVYYTEHIYSGAGTYVISMEDPNRNESIENIPGSVNVPFYIESTLSIAPGLGNNCSPTLANPPIDRGCVGAPYVHNPGAFDPDGDSLAYSLVSSLGTEGTPIDGYVLPNQVYNDGPLYIDPLNGTIVWDSPSISGEYNVAILIEEYRNGVKIGSVVRDMQIDILALCDNDPPTINLNTPICLIAGDTLNEIIEVTDPNPSDILSIEASGSPFLLSPEPVFSSVSAPSPIYSSLYWETSCMLVQPLPHVFNYKASDNHDTIELVDFEIQEVSILAPAVEISNIEAMGNAVLVEWTSPFCTNANRFKIYRKVDSLGLMNDSCQTGVDPSTGYTLIGTTNTITDTFFIDTDSALVHGQKYCYIVTSCFNNGAESIASTEQCTELKQDLPIISKVSIKTTDLFIGEDTIGWMHPTELDTLSVLPPYTYKVYRSEGFNSANQLVFTSDPFQSFTQADSLFFDNNLNTQNSPYTYKIELLSNGVVLGSSAKASSEFLSAEPTDNAVNLSWSSNVPWNYLSAKVYRKESLGNFEFVGTATNTSFQDTGLINGIEYCYYVATKGLYSTENLLTDTLSNLSQITCTIPLDNVAPCAPSILSYTTDCENSSVYFSFSDSMQTCSEDVIGYILFKNNAFGDSLYAFDTLLYPSSNNYTYTNENSIAGCYALAAIDTFFNQSILSDTFCVDNCPLFTLPNVFSLGSNGYNDVFQSFPFRHIEQINLHIYNRWGEEVFFSNDPDFMWDGIHQKSKKQCSEGVYFYTCEVFEIRLKGLQKTKFSGAVHLLKDATSSTENP